MKHYGWLAVHFLRYQWRERLLLTLALAILIGVGMLAAVNFFASSTKQAMNERSSELLGADWLVESSVPLPVDQWSKRAADLGLETTEAVEFLSMVTSGEHMQLASIKAVDKGYPLRGSLQISGATGTHQPTDQVPKQGEVWLSPRLAAAIQIKIGDTIEMGVSKFTVSHFLVQEPDVGLAFLAMAPRVLMNIADLPATKLLEFGSNVEYRFLVSGDFSTIDILAKEIQPEITQQQKITDNMNAQPEIVQPIDQLLHFLTVTGIIIFALAALAIALASRTYAQKQTDSTAILRCLGATSRDMRNIYLISLLLLTGFFSLMACALGYSLAVGLIHLADVWWQVKLPRPLIGHTVWVSLTTGILLVFAFAWPWLSNLQSVSPLRVIQRQIPPPPLSMLSLYGAVVLAFILMWSLYQTPALSVNMAVSVVILLIGFALMTYFLLRGFAYLGRHLKMPWRLGLLQIMQNKRGSLMQIWVFTFVLTLLFFFILVRQDFMRAWENKFPPEAPNYFVINILPEQVDPLKQFFAAHKKTVPEFYPMVRARLVKINDHDVSLKDYPSGDAPNVIRRDLNLSFTDSLGDKSLVKGQGWSASVSDRGLFSVESSMAKDLGLNIGDKLSFQAGVMIFTGEVANIREVDWYTMQPNFYVISTPELLIDFPRTYLGSFYNSSNDEDQLNALIQQFPNLTLIDVDDIIRSIRDILTQALCVIEVLFFMVCLAALLVLMVIQRTQTQDRAFTGAVLRTLGASQSQLVRGWLSEFAVIGLLSGVVAIVLAQGVTTWMISRFFDLPWHFNGLMVFAAPLLGCGIYLCLGVSVTRSLLRSAPVLRLAEDS